MERVQRILTEPQSEVRAGLAALGAVALMPWRHVARWWEHRKAIEHLRDVHPEQLADAGIPFERIREAVTTGHLRQR